MACTHFPPGPQPHASPAAYPRLAGTCKQWCSAQSRAVHGSEQHGAAANGEEGRWGAAGGYTISLHGLAGGRPWRGVARMRGFQPCCAPAGAPRQAELTWPMTHSRRRLAWVPPRILPQKPHPPLISNLLRLNPHFQAHPGSPLRKQLAVAQGLSARACTRVYGGQVNSMVRIT